MAAADLFLLHTLRCVGFAGLDRVAAITGLEPDDAESELIDLAVAGLVTRHSGPFGGWGLTPAGKESDARLVATELQDAGARTAVEDAFRRFGVLNPELLDLCTAWQTRNPDTAELTARVLAGFTGLHERAAPVCDDLTAALPRFGRYHRQLGAALDRARAGETAFLTDEVDSYHGIWFHLHEDLLVTLALPR